MITFGFRNKFSGWIRALIAIVIGIIMVVIPGKALVTVVWILAALLVGSGIASMAYAVAHRGSGSVGLLGFNTIVNILLGVLLFIFPAQVTSILIIILGIALTGFGLFQILALASASNYIRLGFFTFILPVLCVIGGMLVLFNPFGTAETVTMVCGIAVLVYGVSELISSWRMHKAWEEYEIKYPEKEETKEEETIDYQDIKDADFEKVDDSSK